MKVQSTDLAWAAGFFDGEGTVGCRGRERAFRLELSVAQKNREELEHFKWCVGDIGRVREDREPKRKISIFRWSASAREAAIVLRLLLPYLVGKREQAVIALRIREMCPGSGHPLTEETISSMSAMKDEIRRLKRVGVY